MLILKFIFFFDHILVVTSVENRGVGERNKIKNQAAGTGRGVNTSGAAAGTGRYFFPESFCIRLISLLFPT